MKVSSRVMPRLVPGIHVSVRDKAWMAGATPAMTALFTLLDIDPQPNSLASSRRRGDE
jgi:hypothetical protein